MTNRWAVIGFLLVFHTHRSSNFRCLRVLIDLQYCKNETGSGNRCHVAPPTEEIYNKSIGRRRILVSVL
jgi:hypothetical protein